MSLTTVRLPSSTHLACLLPTLHWSHLSQIRLFTTCDPFFPLVTTKLDPHSLLSSLTALLPPFLALSCLPASLPSYRFIQIRTILGSILLELVLTGIIVATVLRWAVNTYIRNPRCMLAVM